MMQLPLTDRELETIMVNVKTSHPNLYNKLWTYKMNVLNKEKKDGLS